MADSYPLKANLCVLISCDFEDNNGTLHSSSNKEEFNVLFKSKEDYLKCREARFPSIVESVTQRSLVYYKARWTVIKLWCEFVWSRTELDTGFVPFYKAIFRSD